MDFDVDTIDYVIDNLYISSAQASDDLDELHKLGITHILIVGNDLKMKEGFECLQIPVDDVESEDISQYFKPAIEFIQSCCEPNNILVHCGAGVSRSATIVIAYLMKEFNMTYDLAERFLKLKRSIIQPNDGFIKQLNKF
jgi:protein-tyrosine phosphatase